MTHNSPVASYVSLGDLCKYNPSVFRPPAGDDAGDASSAVLSAVAVSLTDASSVLVMHDAWDVVLLYLTTEELITLSLTCRVLQTCIEIKTQNVLDEDAMKSFMQSSLKDHKEKLLNCVYNFDNTIYFTMDYIDARYVLFFDCEEDGVSFELWSKENSDLFKIRAPDFWCHAMHSAESPQLSYRVRHSPARKNLIHRRMLMTY